MTPGSMAAVYGNFLVHPPSEGSGSPLPTQLSDLSVQLGNGLTAPLLSASNGKITFQVP
ncbi:MAG: hypothetical protein ACLQMO_11215, partial [Acidobacteriaceae bacterium]